MARDLVKENAEKPVAPPVVQEKPTAQAQVQVITTEQAMLTNLDAVYGEVQEIKALILEMANQVGVKFQQEKK